MNTEHPILTKVMRAKKNRYAEDMLIQEYIPFICSETAKFMKHPPHESDDELSIAMIAFHEAIHSYSEERGAFLSFAAMLIRSRLVDYYRKEKRHMDNISIHETFGETESSIEDTLADEGQGYHDEKIICRDATRTEIEELSAQMQEFGVSLTDVSENCPTQQRNKAICLRAMQYAREHTDILDEFLRTKRLPLAKLSEGSNAARKTLERHRKYLIALLLICTNGYEIIRGHLKQVLKGGVTA